MKEIEGVIDSSGILLTKDAIEAGISKHSLYSFIKENAFEQVAHGVYASPEAWEVESYILSLRCPQGVLSHDEALYYHGLIDREPLQQTITIYAAMSVGIL